MQYLSWKWEIMSETKARSLTPELEGRLAIRSGGLLATLLKELGE